MDINLRKKQIDDLFNGILSSDDRDIIMEKSIFRGYMMSFNDKSHEIKLVTIKMPRNVLSIFCYSYSFMSRLYNNERYQEFYIDMKNLITADAVSIFKTYPNFDHAKINEKLSRNEVVEAALAGEGAVRFINIVTSFIVMAVIGESPFHTSKDDAYELQTYIVNRMIELSDFSYEVKISLCDLYSSYEKDL